MTVIEEALFAGVSVQTVYSRIRLGHPAVGGLDRRNQKFFHNGTRQGQI